ncbi:MAG TPA: AEC family transporter [Candidatus Atribacteria bacterium]|nr:AEC family transporter [Candidatus Atribacteria bacterium]
MDTKQVVAQVVTLFLVLLVGVYANRKNIITGEMSKKFSDLLINVTVPLQIIASFHLDFDSEKLYNAGLVFVGSFGVHLLSVLIAQLVFSRFTGKAKGVLKFAAVFSNCGFMGYPVLESIYGGIGIFYGSIYVIPFHIFSLTYGIMVFTGESGRDTLKNLKKVLLHPGLVAVAAGMVMFLLSIKLPQPIYKAVSMAGSVTSPLAMMIVGSVLARQDFKEMLKGFPVYFLGFIRLIMIPVVVWGILRLIPLHPDIKAILVILSAMPVAANAVIFSEQYGGDSGLASRCVGISTLFSIVTIPLVLLLLG